MQKVDFLPQVNGILLLGCVAAFLLTPLDSKAGLALFSWTGTAMISWNLLHWRQFHNARRNLPLALATLCISLNCLIWFKLYQQPGEFMGVYLKYKHLARSLGWGAIIFFMVSNFRFKLPAKTFYWALIVGGCVIDSYAIDIYLTTGIDRITLSMQAATTAAYVLTAINLLTLHSIFTLRPPHLWLLLLAALFISECAIILTGTRSAMIVYPLAAFTMFTRVTLPKQKKVTVIALAAVVTFLVGILMQSVIKTRVNALQNDISLLDSNTGTSTGTRLVLLQTGWNAAKAAPFGQSAEQRASIVRELIAQDPLLAVANLFLNDHMHNEFVEAFSLRGYIGILLLAGFYSSIFLASRNNNRQAKTLPILGGCLITYGLIDVIFFNREGYMTYLSAIVLLIASSRWEGASLPAMDKHSNNGAGNASS